MDDAFSIPPYVAPWQDAWLTMSSQGEKPSPLAYELLVSRLIRTRLEHDRETIPQVHHRKQYQGSSGQRYEIDISFETGLAGARILVFVECKCYRSRVSVEEILEFAYKVRDVGAHKGIFVTTVGFQSGARTVAVREGIALAIAVRATEEMQFISSYSSKDGPRYVVFLDASDPPGQAGAVPGGLGGAMLRMLFGKDFRYPRGTHYDTVPVRKWKSQAMGVDPGQRGDLIKFEPAIEGFYGDPMTLIAAADVFCIESEIDRGVLPRLEVFSFLSDYQ